MGTSTLSADVEERPGAHCTQVCYTPSTLSAFFPETIGRRENMNETKNMYFKKTYNFCFEYLTKCRLFAEKSAKNHEFYESSMVSTTKIELLSIFSIIFLLRASKYVGICSFEKIGAKIFSELLPRFLFSDSRDLIFIALIG